MGFKKTIAFIFLLYWAPSLGLSQDIHWSQFMDNPIFQNAGNTGHFKGDMRLIGNYRDQWRSVTIPFSTLSFSVDGQPFDSKKIGVGGLVFHDVAGDGRFRTIELQGTMSYALQLSKDSMHLLRAGIHLGFNHRQLNTDQFYFDNQFNGIQFNPALASNENFQSDRRTSPTVGIGAVYHYYVHDRMNFSGGLGMFNLNRPNHGFYGDVIPRDTRLNVFASGIYAINDDWDVLPSTQLNVQGKYREFIMGSRVKYTLIDRLGDYRALYGGLFYRNRDAAFISLGMDYQDWFVGLSYDINFSRLVPASRARGGFEIAVRYILHRFNPKRTTHRICPDYI